MSKYDIEAEIAIQNEIARQREQPIEKRQSKLQINAEARERWMKKLFRAVTEVRKLEQERKRLLGPNRRGHEPRRMSLDEIRERAAIGGDEFNDEIPS